MLTAIEHSPDALCSAQTGYHDDRFVIMPTALSFSCKGATMKAVAAALILAFASASAFAATCTATAQEKKLAGAAKTSFLKKCESDATATCEAASAEKKLAGAAKNSFMKKCAADAVGQ
jgi:hypothetical protein